MRTIFSVVKLENGWAVEHEGALTNRSPDKAIVIASANRLARQAMLGGVSVQVRIDGESGYF